LTYCCIAMLPYCHTAVLPYCSIAILLYCHVDVLPYCHIDVLPCCRIAIFTYCRIRIYGPISVCNWQAHFRRFRAHGRIEINPQKTMAMLGTLQPVPTSTFPSRAKCPASVSPKRWPLAKVLIWLSLPVLV
jgi:hypothetical protein